MNRRSFAQAVAARQCYRHSRKRRRGANQPGDDELQATYKVDPSHGAVTIAIGWNAPIVLQPTLRDEFHGQLPLEFREPIVMQFVRDGGAVTGFDLFAGFADGVRKIRFVKKD